MVLLFDEMRFYSPCHHAFSGVQYESTRARSISQYARQLRIRELLFGGCFSISCGAEDANTRPCTSIMQSASANRLESCARGDEAHSRSSPRDWVHTRREPCMMTAEGRTPPRLIHASASTSKHIFSSYAKCSAMVQQHPQDCPRSYKVRRSVHDAASDPKLATPCSRPRKDLADAHREPRPKQLLPLCWWMRFSALVCALRNYYIALLLANACVSVRPFFSLLYVSL